MDDNEARGFLEHRVEVAGVEGLASTYCIAVGVGGDFGQGIGGEVALL